MCACVVEQKVEDQYYKEMEARDLVEVRHDDDDDVP